MTRTTLTLTALITIALSTLSGCGGDSKKMGGEGSNIPYLKSNHTNYTESTSTNAPAPIKDANAKTITWNIKASTEIDAIKLYDHIAFMDGKLQIDKNPRAWDELFLLEAFMKNNHRYTTVINRITNTVIVTKTATDACAYQVISAHGDVVKNDFFAQGIINIDHSSIAQTIINSADCAVSKTDLATYILNRKK